MSANHGWSAEKDAELLALQASGLSSRGVAARLGLKKTAVIDRAKLLDRPFVKPAAQPPKPRVKAKVYKLPAPSSFAPLNIPFMELESHHCREVVGTGDDGLAIYCGHIQSKPTSYCNHHRQINFVVVAGKSKRPFVLLGIKARAA